MTHYQTCDHLFCILSLLCFYTLFYKTIYAFMLHIEAYQLFPNLLMQLQFYIWIINVLIVNVIKTCSIFFYLFLYFFAVFIFLFLYNFEATCEYTYTRKKKKKLLASLEAFFKNTWPVMVLKNTPTPYGFREGTLNKKSF